MSNKDVVTEKTSIAPEEAHPRDNKAHQDSANAAPEHAEPPQHEAHVGRPAQFTKIPISQYSYMQNLVYTLALQSPFLF